MKELWVEKYRPKTLDGYVFRDEKQRAQILGWIEEGSIPHLLLSGSAGVGKTTLAKILVNELGVQDTDVLSVNASKDGRKIDWFRDKLEGYCQTMPFGEFKVVILDEADYLNPQSVQPAMRNLMEEYSHSVRFILTCNYPNKIIPPLHSRCQSIHIEKTDMTEFTARVATILVTENVEFDLDTLDTYVKATYPDLRKCINNVQMNSLEGKLTNPEADNLDNTSDYRIEMVELFKKGKINEARKLLCSQARPEEMDDIYRWMYNNIDLFGKDEETQDNAVLVIKQGLVDHTLVADPEINLAATLIRLARLQQ
jgi:DNA polymerase III delta prime subunit